MAVGHQPICLADKKSKHKHLVLGMIHDLWACEIDPILAL